MVRATGTAGCASCGSVAGHLAHEVSGAWPSSRAAIGYSWFARGESSGDSTKRFGKVPQETVAVEDLLGDSCPELLLARNTSPIPPLPSFWLTAYRPMCDGSSLIRRSAPFRPPCTQIHFGHSPPNRHTDREQRRATWPNGDGIVTERPDLRTAL
jgi:hypothetical protein